MATAVVTILLGDIVQRRGTWMVVQMTKVGTTRSVMFATRKQSTADSAQVTSALNVKTRAIDERGRSGQIC